MTDIDLNKRLHEIMGLCWHKWINQPLNLPTCIVCAKCYCSGPIKSQKDLVNTWEGFGVLWEWLQKQEKWEEFWDWVYAKAEGIYETTTKGKSMPSSYFWMVYLVGGLLNTENKCLINPRALAEAVVGFFAREDKQ